MSRIEFQSMSAFALSGRSPIHPHRYLFCCFATQYYQKCAYCTCMQIDSEYLKRLQMNLRLLSPNRNAWTIQDVLRFTSMLKIDCYISDLIHDYGVDGAKLVDVDYLQANLESVLTLANYLPMYKLFFVVNALLDPESKEKTTRKPEKGKTVTPLNIESKHILAIKAELLRMNDIQIIELSGKQLGKLMQNAGLEKEASLALKFNVDGFALVCSLADENLLMNIKNYFPQEDIQALLRISALFMPQYFRQKYQIVAPLDQSQIQFNEMDIETTQSNIKLGESFVESEFGMSESLHNSIPMEIRNSMGVSVRNSMGVSVRNSMGVSVRNSMAESIYVDSQLMESTKNTQKDIVRVSSIEDHTTIKSLRSEAMLLPFNLLRLEPLQCIRVAQIVYPFSIKKQIEKRESKLFNLLGARFGRNQQNDFRYPDELSISGKHAQVIFKSEGYYIRDLGSKTGTFIYINPERPLDLEDDMCLQLSCEVEIKIRILKTEDNEGVIKVEFKKPEDEPAYKATLKNKNTIRMGKSQNSHIRLANPHTSSKHAQIRYEDNKFSLVDCYSSAGTWLRLSARGVKSPDVLLAKGDIFRISNKKVFLVEQIANKLQSRKGSIFSQVALC